MSVKLGELDLKDWQIRHDVLLINFANDIDEFKCSLGEEHPDFSHLSLLNLMLDSIDNMMRAEALFLNLAEEISDAKATFLVQKNLHDFVNDVLYPSIKDTHDTLYSTASFCELYDSQKLARLYNQTLEALLQVYEELYLGG